ncbi:serine/threonine-protein kinase [Tsukamurella sp. PLM1]|uniref:serine/threonine-protein kinase n=1 Tax=Tsukamurella sp. PLM1 TaxID=2929795 RepID=UPI002046152D|nr:serine/threonine-protein kinase [Tsukamurella sp. PLM1]BDH56154.1 hypothetical protein MTP03_10930 [Tsukamurella sp. PLM1]
MALEQGEVFAGYTIVRQLGAGGMGEVYLAQHPRLPRQDAIKVLPPHLASDDAFRLRFLREADLAAGLRHPNIVSVLDRGEENGRLWLSMPFVDGIDGAARLGRSPRGLPLDEVIAIVQDTAAALDYAHQRGVLHRDVKPANILLDGSQSLLTDFGIARAAGDDSDLTATGTTIGSVAYAAPEQLRGDPIDARADVYSLAATTYALLTGSRPFERSNPAAVVAAALDGAYTPISVSRNDLPPTVDTAIARAMSRDRTQRPATASDFAAELTAAPSSATHIAPPHVSAGHYDDTILVPTAASPSGVRSTDARRSRWILPTAIGAALVVGGLVAGGAVMVTRSGTSETASTPSVSTSSVGTASAGISTPGTNPTASMTIPPAAGTLAAPTNATPPPIRASGDLGLARPVSTPPCDGRYILVLASIERSNPEIKTLVSGHLTSNPGAEYFYSSALNCSSVRAVDDNGEPFYTPYVDYGTSRAAACNGLQHRGAYVRVLSNTTTPGTNPCQ